MSSTSRSRPAPAPAPQPTYSEESGIECSPTACAKACGGCIMFLISLTAISALGVIAGGAFWTAQAMYTVTAGHENSVDMKFCHPDLTQGQKFRLKLEGVGGLADKTVDVHPCPPLS